MKIKKPAKVRSKSYLATLVVVTLYLQSAFISAPAGSAQDLTTTSDTNQITLAYPFKLGVDQTAYLLPADLVFHFVNVTEDSRCPADVQCIWAGQVSILIEYSRASTGQSLGDFTLTLMGSSSTEVSTIEGYLVKLARVDPYPVSTEQIHPSNYIATLIVLNADIGTPDSFVASGPVVLDGTSGERLENLQVGKQVTLSMALHNSFDDDRQFIAIMEARSLGDGGITRFLAMSNGTVSGKGWIDASLSWMPEQAGEYQLRTFVIDSFVEPRVLTLVMTSEIVVQDDNTKGESIVTLREGQRDGPLLVQKIYADRVEGLNFPEYPVAMDSGLPITLRIGEKASNGCTIVLTLTKIEGDSATFLMTVDEDRPCPICWYQLAQIPGL